jgi:hypothetical protein
MMKTLSFSGGLRQSPNHARLHGKHDDIGL